jgi:PAS domain S-box-containing protein
MADTPVRTAGKAPAQPMWLAVAALLVAIFVADTLTPLEINIAMLYVAPLLVVARFARPAAIVATAAACAALATASFAILSLHPTAAEFSAGVNLLLAYAALMTTTIISIQGWRSGQRLQEQASLLHLTHDTIFVRGMDDVIRYWNRGAEELYGWPAELAVGKVSHDLLQTRFPAPIEDINAELAETGRWEGELTHARRDGSKVVVASRWSLLRDSAKRPELVLETNNDVTSRRQAEYLTGQVFETVPDVMYILGPDHRVQRANPAYARNYDRSPESLVGEHLRDLIGDELFEQTIEPNLRRCFAGESIGISGWWDSPTGRRFLSVDYAPLRPNSDTVEGVLMVAHDLTEQMLAAEALQAAQADLAHANRVATMGQLTASIAHEVNQPIHAVALSAKAALRWLGADPPAADEAQRALNRVVHNAALAGEVLARIRSLVRKAPAKKEPFALREAVRDVLALTAGEADKAGVNVESRLAPGLPLVFGDRVQLQQVILNLVMNAIEAMGAAQDGPRRLQVQAGADDAGGIKVRVSDTGPGLAAEMVNRVFEPFFTTKAQGMGMGLAICRSIVESHGGKLSLAPNEPRGAVFEIFLPATEETVDGELTAGEAEGAV